MFQKRPRRLDVVLDWVTVRYSTVAIGLTVLTIGGVVALVVLLRMRGREERLARSEIQQAESLREEAAPYARDSRMMELLRSADARLDEAHKDCSREDYSEARASAIVSQNYSQKLIDSGRGENTARGEVRFYRIEGDVRVKRAGEFYWEPADSKMYLKTGDQLKTSANSGAQIIYFDGAITTVKAGSLLEIKELYEEPLTRQHRVREKLNWGELEAYTRRPEVQGSFHEVATGGAVARAMDEARFEVKSEESSDESQVTLLEGRLEVNTPGRDLSLSERERIQVKNGRAGDVEKLPMVPRLLSPADQKVFTYGEPAEAQTTLVWDPIKEAVRYHLQVSDRSLFTTTLVDNDQIKSTSVELKGLMPAGYYWRVAAIDANGSTGPASPAWKFRVTQTRLEEGSDAVPPKLVVEDFVQNGPIVIINGKTEPGATLWVDNDRIDVGDTGDFYTVVKLRREGANRIRLVAQDAAGNESTRSLEAFVETY